MLTESVRGGIARGAQAQFGANLTFAVLLVALALGLSLALPGGLALQTLKVIGGLFLLWLGVDGFRSRQALELDSSGQTTLPPVARGILAVLLNPGAWIFLATAASSLLSAAALADGKPIALFAALAMTGGVAVGDGVLVLFGGLGIRRAGHHTVLNVRRGLAVLLAGLGIWLILDGIFGLSV